MRTKIIAAISTAALLAAALGAALAAPGTGSDPFVTLRYLTDTWYPEVEQAMLEQAQEATADTEQAALDRLEELTDSYLAGGDGQSHADAFQRHILVRGDRLELAAGAGLLFEAGRTDLSFAAGALVDVTDGTLVSGGGALTPGHRYVAAEDTACSLIPRTDAVHLSVQGYYDLEESGDLRTPFTDLAEEDWYYASVRFAYEQGLFQGQTTTTFNPGTNMNRAMLATVLRRLAGVDVIAPDAGYTDVAPGDWYADAVNWVTGVGIVTGIGDGTFRPANDVTREQMAVMLYRYARNYLNIETPATGDLSGYPDQDKIAPYAREALSWAVGQGIITNLDGALAPGGTATRAQVATMLQRFSNLLP